MESSSEGKKKSKSFSKRIGGEIVPLFGMKKLDFSCTQHSHGCTSMVHRAMGNDSFTAVPPWYVYLRGYTATPTRARLPYGHSHVRLRVALLVDIPTGGVGSWLLPCAQYH